MSLPEKKIVGLLKRGEYAVIEDEIVFIANNLGYEKKRGRHFLEIEVEDGRVYTYSCDPLERFRSPIEGAEWTRKQDRA